jgi:hypothetical protein
VHEHLPVIDLPLKSCSHKCPPRTSVRGDFSILSERDMGSDLPSAELGQLGHSFRGQLGPRNLTMAELSSNVVDYRQADNVKCSES